MFPVNYILFLQIILFLFITPGTPRIVIFPAGVLEEAELWIRLIVITISIIVFFITKKNLVYPTVLSAILLSLLNSYL